VAKRLPQLQPVELVYCDVCRALRAKVRVGGELLCCECDEYLYSVAVRGVFIPRSRRGPYGPRCL
jgi:hypothetical protein